MAGDADYFGYTTGSNTQLTQLKIMGHHMGEDVTHYPPPENGKYVEPTVNWNDPKYFGDGNTSKLQSHDTIEMIRKRMNAQDATVMYQLADQWFRVLRVIEDIRKRVLDAANGLKYGGDGSPGNHGGWKGKGAEAFLARGPGATIKSLDDWKDAAMVNWQGMLTLAQSVPDHQYKINALYEQYKQDMVAEHIKLMGQWGMAGMPADKLDADQKKEYVAGLRKYEEENWNTRARQIQYGMAQHYWSVMSSEFSGGSATVYEGPSDAVQPDPKFVAKAFMGDPPKVGAPPKLSGPNVGNPNVSTPDVPTPQLPPNLDKPNITPPTIGVEEQLPPDAKPDVTAPKITAPTLAPPVLPTVPVGKQQFGPNNSPGRAPAAPSLKGGPGDLLKNLPGQGQSVSKVLGRSAANAESLPNAGKPSLPPSPMKGQPRVPSAGRGKRAPGEPTQRAPKQLEASGPPNQFGAPPTASSPVLRAPGSPQAPAAGQRRSGTGSQGARSGMSGVLRPGANPSVLNRPRGTSKPVAAPPLSSVPTSALRSDFASPTSPTARPVLGRSTPPVANPEQDRSSGVLHGRQRANTAGYEAQIGSRRMGEVEKVSSVDEEFDKIRQILDQEKAWTVATPGGGVLDSAAPRPVTSVTEPKPTVGAA